MYGKKKKSKKKGTRTDGRRRGGDRQRQRARDGDYDNTVATAVPLWRAAVSTEGNEA